MSGGLPGLGITIISDNFHRKGHKKSLWIELIMSVNAFLDWCSSVVYKSKPVDFLRGNYLIHT